MTGPLAAIGFAAVFGFLSYRLQWLTATGSLISSLFGFSLIYLGGASWIIPVLVFFGTSSILSKSGIDRRERRREDIRNAVQVLANGGIAWILLLVYNLIDVQVIYAGFIGAFAAATADTWATEVGRLLGGTPRSVITGKRVEKGASGGVTFAGSFAALWGSLLIGLIPAFFGEMLWTGLLVGGVSGLSGCFLDSILGATVQVRYIDKVTGAITESRSGGEHHAGLRWVTNDTVNLFCTLCGAVIGMIVWQAVAG